jgi:hypothetical protein
MFSFSNYHERLAVFYQTRSWCSRTQLTLQDLRRLDYQMSPNDGTSILVHHHVVAFCLNPIRALITPKRLVFILHAGAENISSMVQNLMNAWDPESVSFEGHAYNSLFTAMAHIDNITYKSIVERVEIRHAQESEMLKVGVARIRMARVHTFLAVITCAIGFCAYITGIFGMNLDQTIWLQDIYGVFTGVVISTMLFLVLVVISVNVFLMRYGHIPD